MARTGVQRLAVSDVSAAAEVLSSAFAEDPFVAWTFESRTAALVPIAFRLTCKVLAELGAAFGYFDARGQLVAVALYQPPGLEVSLGTAFRSGAVPLLWRSGGRTALRMAHSFNETERFKAECVPSGSYFFLDTLGVHRDHARRGIGSELLPQSLALMRGARTEPCFLLAQPHNRAYYEHRGFRVVGEKLLPKINLPFLGMLENPRA